MSIPSWQLISPITAIIFDCDGTLSSIEGIDELAEKNEVGDVVQRLTAEAMGKSGMCADLYAERLDLVQPTQDQMVTLGLEYFKHQVPDITNVIHILKRLKKSIYIISAGLLPAVADFGKLLQIAEENIYAVNITFDSQGKYVGFDQTSPLINKHGKRIVVNEIKKKHETIAYVGDGLSDYEVYDLVQRFIGYGGAYYRENIADLCQYYIKTLSMAPLLPLLLTKEEYERLPPQEKQIYQRGLHAIHENVLIK